MVHALLCPVRSLLANVDPGLVDRPFQDVCNGDSDAPIFLMRERADALIDFERRKKHYRVAIAELAHPHATYRESQL